MIRLRLIIAASVLALLGSPAPSAVARAHIAAQNTWFTAVELRRYGFENGVISISGHWFLQEGTLNEDFGAFLTKSEDEVVRRLGRFKAAHPEVDPKTDAIVMLDIERPHPKNLHTYSASDQDAIVKAYRVRIAAARAVFPNAKIALYGTLNPDELGRPNEPEYLKRRNALIEAGRERLYDDIDYLVPVLYVRFGCDDVKGRCDPHWDTLDDYTALGIAGSRRLRRSDGSSLPLLPFLGFRVYNGASAFHRELLIKLGVPDPVKATLGMQIDMLAAAGVNQFALWTGPDSNDLGGAKVTDYLCALTHRCWP